MKNEKGFEMAINTMVAFVLVLFALSLVITFFFTEFGGLGGHGQKAAESAENESGFVKAGEKLLGIEHGGFCDGTSESTNCYDYYEESSYLECISEDSVTCRYEIPDCRLIGGYTADNWGSFGVRCRESTICKGIAYTFSLDETFDYEGLSTCVGNNGKDNTIHRSNNNEDCTSAACFKCPGKTCSDFSGRRECQKWPDDYNVDKCSYSCKDFTEQGKDTCEQMPGCTWKKYEKRK